VLTRISVGSRDVVISRAFGARHLEGFGHAIAGEMEPLASQALRLCRGMVEAEELWINHFYAPRRESEGAVMESSERGDWG
jgi:hypothetical protein